MKYNGFLLISKRMISSTNDYILKRCNSLADKTIIYAKKQACGRGRQNNKWYSPIGNLYASFLYKIDFSLMRILPELSQIVALSVKNICANYIENFDSIIKWPNDILVNQKKIAGILIETAEQKNNKQNNAINGEGTIESKQKSIVNVIIGIGINLNAKSDFSININQPATSFYIETGDKVNAKALLLQLIDEIDKDINKWKKYGFSSFFNEWKNNVSIKGRAVLFFNEGLKTHGVIQGIENDKIKIEANSKYYLKELCDIIIQ